MFRTFTRNNNNNFGKLIKRKFSDNKHNYVNDAKQKIINFDKYRINNYPNIPIFQISLGCGLFSLFSGGFYLIFSNQINSYLSGHGSQIAGNIVNSDDVKTSVNNLIEDPELTKILNKMAIDILNKLCDDVAVNTSIANLLINVFNRKDVQDELTKCIIKIIRQPIIYQEINNIIKETTENETNVKQINELVTNIIKNEETSKSVRECIYNIVFGKS
jgi:hypothetical protein